MTVITAEDGVPGPLPRKEKAPRVVNRWKETERVISRRAVAVVDVVVRHDVTSAVISAEEEVVVRYDVLAVRMAKLGLVSLTIMILRVYSFS